MNKTELTSAEIAAILMRLSPDYALTPILDLPRLSRKLGVGQIIVKDESRRALGNFKSLGGTYAGLRALARSRGTRIDDLVSHRPEGQPCLICASDGNHGLAVAAAAQYAGASARIYLHSGVPPGRVARIAAQGAGIVRIEGTYDDAVDAASRAARQGDGILVADTSDGPDPVVADVMAGYRVIADEIMQQWTPAGNDRPTHLFVQAGVGGLAAAMTQGLRAWMAGTARVVVVEPTQAACVSAAMDLGKPVLIESNLETAAEMLSCGKASTPALKILQEHDAVALAVSEEELAEALQLLIAHGGPLTTPSGSAGLAGLRHAVNREALKSKLALDETSRILLIVTEGDVPEIVDGG